MGKASRKAGDGKRTAEGRGTTTPDGRVVDLVRQLGAALAEFGLTRVQVTEGARRVLVERALPPAAPMAAAPAVSATSPGPVVTLPDTSTSAALVTVEAPMVGTFYRASSPTADPYVRESDVVKHGQILCIIEAMKLMNEIESKVSGRIVKILVENGQPVEYGQPLFLIDPR